MRIDAYNQIAQLYNVQKQTKTQGVKQTSYTTADQVSISSIGRDFQVAKSAVSEASDIRENKVAQLKAKVESGEYEVQPGDFASKLLEKYNNGLF